MTHRVTLERDTQSFWQRHAEFLLRHESEYSLMIGHVQSILSSDRSGSGSHYFAIRQQSQIVGLAMLSGGNRDLVISQMSPGAARALAEAVAEHSIVPSRVRGPADASEYCAQALALERGVETQLTQRQGLYELREVIWPDGDDGRLVCGSSEQQDLAEKWMEGFIRECFPEEQKPRTRAEDIVKRRLDSGHLYFWQTAEGELVSMAARVRETPNTTSISLVYTPSERRGRGHAGSAVAHLSQLWLDRGKTACNLFTNLANPSSNQAYTRVGYVQLVESHVYAIEKA